jgi:hypothetical protein
MNKQKPSLSCTTGTNYWMITLFIAIYGVDKKVMFGKFRIELQNPGIELALKSCEIPGLDSLIIPSTITTPQY